MQVGVLIVLALAAWEFLRLAIHGFFKRAVGTRYVTETDCRLKRESCGAGRLGAEAALEKMLKEFSSDLGESIDVLREVVLVIAVKENVEEDTLKKLAGRRRRS